MSKRQNPAARTRGAERRERILDAALARFSRYGFRRTSMEDIAGELPISRAALYLEFENKEQIFRSLAERLQARALERARAALAAGGPLERRLAAALEAKYLGFFELVRGSPHGEELLDENSRSCGEISARAEREQVRSIAAAIRAAAAAGQLSPAAAGLSAASAAELLVHAVVGQKAGAVGVAEYRARLRALVRVFVAALRVPPRAPTRRRAR
jgi:AcrR family transcriptional regulator